MKRMVITVWVLMWIFAYPPYQANAQNNSTNNFRVGIAGDPPFVVDTSLQTGISNEVWDKLADKLNINYTPVYFEDIPHAMQALEQGQVQAVAGPVSISSEDATKVLFTQPYFQASLSIMSLSTPPTLWSRIHPFLSKRFFYALAAFILILALVGTCLWLAERKSNPRQFSARPAKGIANGMWCAISTMTTTGYGDVVPRTFWGRFAAAAWMVISLIFATSMIAGISSVLTLSAMNVNVIKTAEELSGKTVGVIAGSTADDFVKEYGGKVMEIDDITQGYQLLKEKKIKAIVAGRPQLQYYVYKHAAPDLVITPNEYQREAYGFAFPLKQKNINDINIALLQIEESGALTQILKKWLGHDAR